MAEISFLTPAGIGAATPKNGVSGRDARVDFLRGIALLMIFVDHVPDNLLGYVTLRNFGFSDAAELFVIFAGFSSMVAYGRVFERAGMGAGIRKVMARCLKLYGYQVVLLLTTLFVVKIWTVVYGTESLILGPILRDGIHGAARGLFLEALPAYLDILPLYLVLIALFPLVYYGLRRSPSLTLIVSFIVYTVVNVLHFNIPNVVEPADVTEWFFNPLAWQLIFVIGACFALASRASGSLPRHPAILAFAWLYLGFSLFVAAPWQLWSHSLGDALPLTLFGNNPKAFLTPWRILHACALVYVALTSVTFGLVSQSRWVSPVVACGRHSLEVFALGSILALFGRLAFRTVGVDWRLQIAVNLIGLTSLFLLASYLDSKKRTGVGSHVATQNSKFPDVEAVQSRPA